MRTLARWSYNHRRIVVAAWLVVVVGLTVIHGAAGSGYSDSFKLSGTDSADALALLQQASPKASGDTDRIVVATRGGAPVKDPAIRARLTKMFDQVAKQPHVGAVVSPFTRAGAQQISRDGRV